MLSTFHRQVAGLLLTGLLVGCGSSDPPEPEVTEITPGKAERVEGPESEVVQFAKQLYAAGLYSVAQDSFASLRESYPLSPYTELAEIKLADADYENKQYDAAALRYEEFLKNHPASPSTAYVLLRAARSHHLSFGGLGRDISPLNQAITLYEQLIKQYPQSPYTLAAADFRQECVETIAEYERSVGRFYAKQGSQEAALARFDYTKNQVEPLVENAKAHSAKVHEQFEHARSFITQSPALAEPPAAKPVRLPEGVMAASLQPLPVSPNGLYVEKVDCNTGEKRRVIIYLSRRIDDQEFTAKLRDIRGTGAIELQLPGAVSREINMTCFQNMPLTVSSSGMLRLQGATQATGFTLSTPPRVVLVLN